MILPSLHERSEHEEPCRSGRVSSLRQRADRLSRQPACLVNLTAVEQKNLVRAGGLLSNFDDRINLAQALGLLDADMVDSLRSIKAMRNACAHCRRDIGFSTPEMREVLALFFQTESAEALRQSNNPFVLRTSFIALYLIVSAIIKGEAKSAAEAKG